MRIPLPRWVHYSWAWTGLVAVAVIVALLMTKSAGAVTVTWSTDEDFAQGTFQGTEVVDGDLKLGEVISTFPVMWVANAGDSTVSKIDTNTGKELARYRTFFWGGNGPWTGPAPSRTTVDSDGNVYVANRHFEWGGVPTVMKILTTGGIDRNGNGVIDTSADSNGNGVIELSEMKPLTDLNGNGIIDPNEIQDERVAWVVRVGNAGSIGRASCMGNDGNVWVGTYNNRVYYKISSSDGAVLAGPYSIGNVNPYGCLVDADGNLWSASLSNKLGKLNTSTGASANYYHAGSDYGIALGKDGKVYQANTSGYTYSRFDPATNTFTYPATSKGIWDSAISVGLAPNGDLFVTRYAGGVYRFAPDGTKLWYSGPQPGTGEARGALVDSNGDVWVNHLWNNNISKYRGSDGAWLGVFPVGKNPYTYSDATGATALGTTTPTGFWTVIHDSGTAGTAWGDLSWDATVPTGATLEFRVRAADTEEGLDSKNYELVNSPFTAEGRYLQIQMKLQPNNAGQSPILHSLTLQSAVSNEPPTADAGGPYAVDEGGSVELIGTGSDPDGDDLTYAWDLDNDGTFETAGQTDTFSAVGLDGPSTSTVGLKGCDDENACATDTATVVISNVAPVVDGGPDHEIVSGDSATKQIAFSDAGVNDGPWSYTIDWGDGRTSNGSTSDQSAPIVASQQYFKPGSYTVQACVTDKDGDTGCDSQVVTVKRLSVTINIKPGSFPNSINPKALVPVAILTTPDFDATKVDWASVRFGPLAVLEAGNGGVEVHGKGHIEDSKELDEKTQDGDLDMVLHFDASDSGIVEGTTEAYLWGITTDGVYIEGSDSVRVPSGNSEITPGTGSGKGKGS